MLGLALGTLFESAMSDDLFPWRYPSFDKPLTLSRNYFYGTLSSCCLSGVKTEQWDFPEESDCKCGGECSAKARLQFLPATDTAEQPYQQD